jgi:hypothetical protein
MWSSWSRLFEGSILHGENKGGENVNAPWNDEATLE